MPWKRYHDASMHPPAVVSGAGDVVPPWVLLDKHAYLASGSNRTTAASRTRDGDEVQATFFVGAPPLVSYLSITCASKFGMEPSILCSEGSLVLLAFIHGDPSGITRPMNHDFYVYDAGPTPSLTLLPHPPPYLFPWGRCYYFHDHQVGLLCYRNSTSKGGGGDAYIVAALCTQEAFPVTVGLYAYDSETKAWTCKPAWFPDGRLPDAMYRCDTVITIGGEAGTMGWVDLMRGIILCDVLPLDDGSEEKELCYIPVPPPIRVDNDLNNSSGAMYRDIAVVADRIMYAEVEMHVRPGTRGPKGSFTIDGWTAITWSRPADHSKEQTPWRKEHEVHAHEVSSADRENNMAPGFELLPTLLDDKGRVQPTLQRIHMGHPKLSLRVGDSTLYLMDKVYLMAKVNRWYDEAWVIAVDMENKRLLGVAEFGGAPRCTSFINAFSQSRISKHLNV